MREEGMNDCELMQRYAQERCESAFAELVRRYIDLVYSAALRQVGGDLHLAKDVTQRVFVDLARKADSVCRHPVLTGWLYTSTSYVAGNAVRAERRRRRHEHESCFMHASSDDPESESREEVSLVLDEAMHALSRHDQNAVLLRYFENRSLAEVGVKLGLSEDAARMRVSRALEKLRKMLVRRGVTSTSAALPALLFNQTVTAAPAGMAAHVVGTAMATAAGAVPASAVLNFIAMRKLKVGVISAVIVVGIAIPLASQYRAEHKRRDENLVLLQQFDELVRLPPANAGQSDRLAPADGSRATDESSSSELLKLHGEVARPRDDARELARLRAAPVEFSGTITYTTLPDTAQAESFSLEFAVTLADKGWAITTKDPTGHRPKVTWLHRGSDLIFERDSAGTRIMSTPTTAPLIAARPTRSATIVSNIYKIYPAEAVPAYFTDLVFPLWVAFVANRDWSTHASVSIPDFTLMRNDVMLPNEPSLAVEIEKRAEVDTALPSKIIFRNPGEIRRQSNGQIAVIRTLAKSYVAAEFASLDIGVVGGSEYCKKGALDIFDPGEAGLKNLVRSLIETHQAKGSPTGGLPTLAILQSEASAPAIVTDYTLPTHLGTPIEYSTKTGLITAEDPRAAQVLKDSARRAQIKAGH